MLFSRWRRGRSSPQPATSTGSLRKSVETLEDRAVPAIDAITGDIIINVPPNPVLFEWYSTAGIDELGNMVVAYLREPDGTGLATNSNDLLFRMLNPDGTAVLEAPLPILVSNNSRGASVAMYRDREFALVWAEDRIPDPGDQADAILLQRFDRNGEPVFNQPLVVVTAPNPNFSYAQPVVDSTPNGDLVVVYREINPQAGSAHTLRFARLNALDQFVGPQTVSTGVDPGAFLAPPALAVNDAGDFIVAWVDQENADGSGPVRFQRYTPLGTPAGVQTLVNTTGFSVDVDIANNRSFVVTWHDEIPNADNQIAFQRFNSNGQALGGPRNVFPAQQPAQQPNVAVNPNTGVFQIAFSNDQRNIALFQFEADGAPVNTVPFLVNTRLVGPQLFTHFNAATTINASMSQMAINGAGDYVITWWGDVSLADPWGVAAKKFLGDRTVSIADAQVIEGDVNVPMTFTLTLDRPAPVPISLVVSTEQLAPNDPRLRSGQAPAIAGVDYIPLNNFVVNIPANSLTANFSVVIIGDTQIEVEEVFAVNVALNPLNPRPSVAIDPDSALGTIIDDDTPAVTVSNGVPAPTVEPLAPPIGNLTPMTFTIAVSKTPTQGNIVLNYRTVNGTAVAGEDFVAANGTVTFAVGTAQLSQDVVVQIRGDGISEPVPPARTLDPNFVETFQLIVEAAPNNANPVRLADPIGVGSIQDSQPAQMIFPTPRFETPEGDGPRIVNIPILLNKPATNSATITVATQDGPPPNGAVAGVDYTAIAAPPPANAFNTIVVNPGDTQFNIQVEILGNTIPERDRDFIVELTVDPAEIFLPGGIGVVTESFTVRILDDDGIELYLIDVSDSMESVLAQDIDGSGFIDSGDDLNGDGRKGTLIDQAVQQVSQSFAASIQRRGAIVVFGRDAKVLDMDPAAGFQAVVQKGQGVDADGLDVFNQVLRTVQVGRGGLYSLATVDPTRTFYEYALPEIFNLGVNVDVIARATIVTDGSGLLASNSPALAGLVAAGLPVSAIVLGPYSTVGSTRDLDLIVAATGGARQNVNQELSPTSATPANGPPIVVQSAAASAQSLNLLGAATTASATASAPATEVAPPAPAAPPSLVAPSTSPPFEPAAGETKTDAVAPKKPESPGDDALLVALSGLI